MTANTTQEMVSQSLLSEPVALLSAWKALIASQHHLHSVDAARQLGVPEAALFGCRVGNGAIQMRTQLELLLKPASEWGKLLIASRNGIGVALMILDNPAVALQDRALHLTAPLHEALLSCDGIATCYLLEDHDAHGHTFSLNWFDGSGDVLGRLFLLSKSGREKALPHLHKFALAEQPSRWQSSEEMAPLVRFFSNTTADGAVFGEQAAHWGEAVVLACPQPDAVSIWLDGRGAAVRYTGKIDKAHATPPAVHALDPACKLHLQMTRARSAQVVSVHGGLAGLRLEDESGAALTIAPNMPNEKGRAWVEARRRLHHD